MEHCQGCHRESYSESLADVVSQINFKSYRLCPACFDHNAEPIEAIVTVVRDEDAGSWERIPEEIRNTIRDYDIDDDVTLRVWAMRMATRQVGPHEPSPKKQKPIEDRHDEEFFQDLVAKWRSISIPHSQVAKNGFKGFLKTLVVMFLDWRTA